MPAGSCYLPLQVGSAGRDSFGIARDDVGEHISSKNLWYCYLGLVHYRRLFAHSAFSFTAQSKKNSILGPNDWAALLRKHPLILPKRRNYFIENRKKQFAHAHGEPALRYTEEALQACCPEYLPAYEKVMARTWGHIFNMFVMRRDLCDAYCVWLFSLLAEIENRIEYSEGTVPPRILGFISERLLDVWIEHSCLQYKEIPYVSLERVNWPAKIIDFMKRRYGRR